MAFAVEHQALRFLFEEVKHEFMYDSGEVVEIQQIQCNNEEKISHFVGLWALAEMWQWYEQRQMWVQQWTVRLAASVSRWLHHKCMCRFSLRLIYVWMNITCDALMMCRLNKFNLAVQTEVTNKWITFWSGTTYGSSLGGYFMGKKVSFESLWATVWMWMNIKLHGFHPRAGQAFVWSLYAFPMLV